MKFSSKKIYLAIAAPLSAAIVSIIISSLALLATKKSPIDAFKTMWEFGATTSSVIETLNTATSYYIAAIAIAITFRAGLFNIGVEGQLRLAALFSMYLGAMFTLPPILHVLAIFIIAMTVGGLWAGATARGVVDRCGAGTREYVRGCHKGRRDRRKRCGIPGAGDIRRADIRVPCQRVPHRAHDLSAEKAC